MNLNKLKELEKKFFIMYPNAFENEELKKHGKKHNIQKRHENVLEVCSKENLEKGLSVFDDVAKVVVRSTLVSVFEKVKFKDLVKMFDDIEKHMYLDGVYELLHGDEEQGMKMLVDLLGQYKLAKWPIITIYRAYYYPQTDIFVKPTTVKKIIQHLELEDIKYTPKVNFEFYKKYRVYFNELKKHVDSRLYPNNPAFSGFLMVTIF